MRHQSQRGILNIHLYGNWNPLIIFIITLVYKLYVVKVVTPLSFSISIYWILKKLTFLDHEVYGGISWVEKTMTSKTQILLYEISNISCVGKLVP